MSRRLLPLLATLALLPLAASSGAAQENTSYFFPEGTAFDASIPSPQEFLGYPIGSFHTRHDRIVAYMETLAELSDRATVRTIGWTHEHRPMPVLTVSSPANVQRLEQIRVAHMAATEAEATEDLPVIMHLGYGVHGNETSSAEAAMLTAYWLVAGTGTDVARYLDEGVYHVEPVLNPDGRDRHTNWANMHRAEPLVTDPLDREHNEVWPGGRTNHYWFDLNRDWLPLVHPESQARIDFHQSWRPHVVTDYHEMGTSSTYFFEPSEPVGSWNPLLPERLYTDITMRFADDWAASLDSLGALYFTKEVYDNTYPGYGSTYPNFLGGLGLVFEQASARGHAQDSDHHGVLTFAFAIRNHVRTSLATVRVAVEERTVLQDYQREFFRTGIEEAADGAVGGWVFGDAHDPSLNRAFLDLLLRHRIRTHELSAAVEAGGHTFQPGTAWVVPASQPAYRLARSIFERTETFADSVFYDASAWTVSLAYGVPDAELGPGSLPVGAEVTAVPEAGDLSVDRSTLAYLMDWRDSGAPTALRALQAAGLRAEMSTRGWTSPTTRGEVAFGAGSISIPVGIQTVSPDSVHRAVQAAAVVGQVPAHAATTGYSSAGSDLGSRSFGPVRAPRILMPIGDGVSSYEVGQLWHLLDQRVGQPVTKVDTDDIGRVDWADYDVLVLVSGGVGSMFSGARLERLQSWVREGGTLIAVRNAAAWAAANGFTPNIDPPGSGGNGADGEDEAPTRLPWADAGDIQGAQAIGGSIWAADLDLTHPLAFGYTQRTIPVWRDHSLFLEPSDNPYGTVAQLTDDPHLSGYISDENEARLAGSPSVLADRLGGGSVVLLVDNPNFRGFWRGTTRLFLNAVYFGDRF
ncbi:MAG: zinc carboxypeptidase [Gemmatimonadetes bacterium]|nr:zinc carboxypeptidase [Gemmatimonadota bacterium]